MCFFLWWMICLVVSLGWKSGFLVGKLEHVDLHMALEDFALPFASGWYFVLIRFLLVHYTYELWSRHRISGMAIYPNRIILTFIPISVSFVVLLRVESILNPHFLMLVWLGTQRINILKKKTNQHVGGLISTGFLQFASSLGWLTCHTWSIWITCSSTERHDGTTWNTWPNDDKEGLRQGDVRWRISPHEVCLIRGNPRTKVSHLNILNYWYFTLPHIFKFNSWMMYHPCMVFLSLPFFWGVVFFLNRILAIRRGWLLWKAVAQAQEGYDLEGITEVLSGWASWSWKEGWRSWRMPTPPPWK